tara:strand:+ start:3604 stop:4461 length:858 start_codon:yes stop_codon:yes gene_type:complete
MNVIGLGRAGCAIAECFSKFPQYQVYKFDVGAKGENCFHIPKRSSHQEYEEKFPNFKKKLKGVKGKTLFVLAGAGTVSGAALRLLEQLNEAEVTVLYIEPDLSLLGELQQKHEKIVKNVFQEYARSGRFERIYMVSNQAVEACVGDVPIIEYYQTLNQAIVNTFHMVNVFANSDALLGTFTQPAEIARISTLGIVDVEKNEEKWFYHLRSPRDVIYYYGINEDDLKTDGTLFKKITSYIKRMAIDKVNISYGIYETNYEQKYCYCIKHSSVVQSYIDEIDDQDIG